MTLVSYQDELKEIWRDNITATKSLVLKQEQEQNRDGVDGTSERYYFHHKFITKVHEWNNNSSGSGSKTRNKLRGL